MSDKAPNLTPVQERLFRAARAQVQALRATASTSRIATMLLPRDRFNDRPTRFNREMRREAREGLST